MNCKILPLLYSKHYAVKFKSGFKLQDKQFCFLKRLTIIVSSSTKSLPMRLITLLSLFFIFNGNIWGQNKDLKKANQLFKEDKYALAIPHYKKALTTKKNLSIKSKLAFCYKITNRIEEAGKLYEEIITNERAKTKSYYYYAETLMSSGRYDEAKNWFSKYAIIEPDDETVDRMIASCDFAKTVPAHFGHATICPFSQNSEADDNAPVFWENGIVFTSDRKGKLKFLDTKSGTTDRNYLRLYHSEQRPDGTYNEPKEYISKINDARKNTGMATFQPSGTSMFFTRNGNHLNKQNAYCLQLYEAKSSNGKTWEKAEQLNFCRTASNYMHPAISADGKSLFFVSDKAGGLGGTDIYVSKKEKNRWGKPQNLGPKINTNGHEGFPFMHQNGKLYFCSKGHLGLGGFDIFVTQLDENGEWETPTNLGAPINSPTDDISIFISENEEKGLFTSSREGGDDDIFLVSFIPEAVAINQTIISPMTKEATNPPPPIPVPVTRTFNQPIVKEKIPEFEENKVEIVKEEKVVERKVFLEQFSNPTTNVKKDEIYALPSIQFSEGEYFVTYKIANELDQIATLLKEYPSLKIEFGTHTANLNSFEEKMSLTQKRADAILDYLSRKNIDKNKVQTKGYGGQQPLNNCLMDIDCSIEEHAVNDRVEIRIIEK